MHGVSYSKHTTSIGRRHHLTTTVTLTITEQNWINSIVKLWMYGMILQPLLQMILKKNATVSQVWNILEILFWDIKDGKAIKLDNKL